jgi:hypothetical protein
MMQERTGKRALAASKLNDMLFKPRNRRTGVLQKPLSTEQPEAHTIWLHSGPDQPLKQSQRPGCVQLPVRGLFPLVEGFAKNKRRTRILEYSAVHFHSGPAGACTTHLQPSAQMGWSQLVPFHPGAHTQVPGTLHEPPLVSAQPARHTGMLH